MLLAHFFKNSTRSIHTLWFDSFNFQSPIRLFAKDCGNEETFHNHSCNLLHKSDQYSNFKQIKFRHEPERRR